MATFRVKYVYEGREDIYTVKAVDSETAGKTFNRLYPHIPAANVQEITKLDSNPEEYVADLFVGNVGLAVTYWVYGVLGGIVWAVGIVALNPDPNGDLVRLVWICLAVYYVFVCIGIWRAADKYSGNKAWAILAKFAIVVVALPTAIYLLKRFAE